MLINVFGESGRLTENDLNNIDIVDNFRCCLKNVDRFY